ncbi:MAG: reverse transcriptase family protein, partial [Cyanobacteria bacterium J06553_1]
MLKEYYDREESEPQTQPVLASTADLETEISDPTAGVAQKFKNSEILSNLDKFLSHLEESQKHDVKQVLKNSSKIFGDIPSVTTLIEHDIELLQDTRPIKQRPYRVNPAKQEKIKTEIAYMKENGIIENSSSEWSSPCLVVPKPDGSSRLCTDFRKLNDVTIPDNYPLPRISDCVEKIGQSKFITKIDLLKGYYQIPLTERAKRISAFVTCDGFYQYNVMAFGLRNAPSTFQRLANKLIQDLKGSAVYLDDLVVFSETWPQHVKTLTELFSRLETANLTVNLAKSEIGKATLSYLGFEVGNGQLKPLEAKISAVMSYPVPQTRKELRRFLGMTSFYRSFCPNLSEIIAPLTDLTSPNSTFKWNSGCQAAFEKAKEILG